jgi:hypothetical protein
MYVPPALLLPNPEYLLLILLPPPAINSGVKKIPRISPSKVIEPLVSVLDLKNTM